MSNVVLREHIEAVIGDHTEIERGEFELVPMQQLDGLRGEYLLYGCPRGQGLCGVPLKPLSNPPHNTGWTFDGNRKAPTLTPSINCTGGCQWHGFITNGQMTDCP